MDEAAASIGQFTSMWRRFVNECGNADTTDLPDMAIRWADNAFAFWNLIFLTGQGTGPDALAAQLQDAVGIMRGKTRMGFLCVCEELLSPAARDTLPDAVAQNGLELALTMYGMEGDLLAIAAPQHATARFERVNDEQRLEAFADINSLAYGMKLESVRPALAGSALWKHEMQTYLAYDGAVAVAAAATAANDGSLFLALVATLPTARRRGFGDAVVRKALIEGARATGLTRTVLHATVDGFPVYARLGYRQTATIRTYKLQG